MPKASAFGRPCWGSSMGGGISGLRSIFSSYMIIMTAGTLKGPAVVFSKT